jgi:hypothetical protein
MPGNSRRADNASGVVSNTMAQPRHKPASNRFGGKRGFSATIWNSDSFINVAM